MSHQLQPRELEQGDSKEPICLGWHSNRFLTKKNLMSKSYVASCIEGDRKRGMTKFCEHLLSLFEAITRSQSLTLCFFRNFLVKYFRYLQMHNSKLHTPLLIRHNSMIVGMCSRNETSCQGWSRLQLPEGQQFTDAKHMAQKISLYGLGGRLLLIPSTKIQDGS